MMQSPDAVPLAHPAGAVEALVDSLWSDPFYAQIARAVAGDAARRAALARYFDYSMTEGARIGRLIVSPDPAPGAAIWTLPQVGGAAAIESAAKRAFMAAAMGAAALDTWQRIIDFMEPRAAAVVEPSAWYLSILGVTPVAQGRGVGARMLAPTLAEADAAGVDCFLETFDDRNPRFYQRLGFRTVATHLEPVTGCTYAIMLRRTAPTRMPAEIPR
jgi:GNAT superfamily N-acetyltransferase